jgi:small subunit ribosomal protein S3
MGQKVNPNGIRVGIIRTWDSRWYQKRGYADTLHEDLKIRRHLEKTLKNAEVGRVEIFRYSDRLSISIHTSRPGIVIGKKGADIERLKKELQKITNRRMNITISEIQQPELSAALVAGNIGKQLVGRVSYKKAMKQAIQNAIKNGAKGIKIILSGRLGGAEMARTETYKEGRIPLHTFRADVDYAVHHAITQMGSIGVKVWIFKGEVIKKEDVEELDVTPKK